ncbi:unknown protein [Waddlia chondrophila 2032/99]|uniref:Uncharacterized protein n=1 Tax=Waddlia chondrophila 2032/99 TaxID=765953 RepID=F8LE68_9BACT|nr:unknown protein [Waddlia chondrophila 2032/99]
MPLDDVFAGFLGIDVNVVDLLDAVADGVIVVVLAGVYVAKAVIGRTFSGATK